MALPVLLQKLFKSSGYGPELNDEIVSRYISVQDWSNAYDYPVNTLARGSDGLLYWSVAQSGPNVGGAQDPTADNGAYWSSLPTRAPGLGDRSASAATTKWVKDLAATSIYVSPSGSNNSDGMSAATAVQTIAKAIDIAKALPQKKADIIIAGGSYSGGFTVSDGLSCKMELQDNATVTGDILVEKKSTLEFSGPYSLYIVGKIELNDNSYLNIINNYFSCTYADTGINSGTAIFAYSGSVITINCACSITASTCFSCFSVTTNGLIILNGSITINANTVGRIFSLDSSGFVYISVNSTLSITGSNVFTAFFMSSSSVFVYEGGSLSIGDNVATIGLDLEVGSSCYFTGVAGPIYISCIGNCIQCSNGSLVDVNCKFTVKKTGTGGWVTSVIGSSSLFFRDNSNITIDSGATNYASAFFIVEHSTLRILKELTVNGAYTDHVFVVLGTSFTYVANSATITNNATGSRYLVSTCSAIDVGGAGVNRLPGSTSGSADGSAYGYYG